MKQNVLEIHVVHLACCLCSLLVSLVTFTCVLCTFCSLISGADVGSALQLKVALKLYMYKCTSVL